MWCNYCPRMYVNGKMIPVENISGIGERGDKVEW
jgi:hypothetical protein